MNRSTEILGQALAIRADDGEVLQATLFESPTQSRSPVLIASALGTTQHFYAPFASWMAERGHTVMTFDLRGIGASRREEHRRSLRGLDVNMLTWARVDFASAVRTLCAHTAQQRVTLVGHSLGVHNAAMTNGETQSCLEKVISVAAGSGYWRDWATPSRRKAPLMLHLAGPLLTPLFGYFPGRRLGMVADLPAPVMHQWTRWCRHPGFAWGSEPQEVIPSLQSARFRIEAFSFTDDDAMTESCTQKLLDAMPNAPSTLRVLAPSDVGLTAIGHVGAFRRNAASLWPHLVAGIL
ncbi:alpha/beta hydrolase family protein [Polycyclovorans algicola]|uniref:alpha/beta hydrolase family protein n=1 Tax=Polycyclovorans algicola TaxID=616992 RepID=UPI0013790F66|nr:alpha/beta fold hydrolase [Polycyclovorans algicola]